MGRKGKSGGNQSNFHHWLVVAGRVCHVKMKSLRGTTISSDKRIIFHTTDRHSVGFNLRLPPKSKKEAQVVNKDEDEMLNECLTGLGVI